MALKIDIHEGTRLRVGVRDYRHTQAVRTGRVTGLTTARTALSDAIEEVLSDVTVDPHPDIYDLPLQWVEAVRFGKEKAWLRLGYGYGRGTNVTAEPKLACRTRLYTEPVMVYRSFRNGAGDYVTDQYGLPNGEPLFSASQASDLDNKPIGRIYRRPCFRVAIPTTLNQHPAQSVGAIIEAVNDATVIFGGMECPAGWVRFDGLDTDVLETKSGYAFPTTYVFTVARGGHYEQELIVDPQGSGKWVTRTALNYLTASFSNFPYSN